MDDLTSGYNSFANPVGRSDFEMTGIPGTEYYKDDRVVEFPYYNVRTYVVYIVANKGYRFWEV